MTAPDLLTDRANNYRLATHTLPRGVIEAERPERWAGGDTTIVSVPSVSHGWLGVVVNEPDPLARFAHQLRRALENDRPASTLAAEPVIQRDVIQAGVTPCSVSDQVGSARWHVHDTGTALQVSWIRYGPYGTRTVHRLADIAYRPA